MFIEKPPEPARAPGLHCTKSSDPLGLQWCYILPLKHFFKVYYETMWLRACQKLNCRIQWILSGREAALLAEKLPYPWRIYLSAKGSHQTFAVWAVPGCQVSLEELLSVNIPLSHFAPLPNAPASESKLNPNPNLKAACHLRRRH